MNLAGERGVFRFELRSSEGPTRIGRFQAQIPGIAELRFLYPWSHVMSTPTPAPAADSPTPSVRTPKSIWLGACVALLTVIFLVSIVYFGPKGNDRWGAASRPTGGNKVPTPATAGSEANAR